MLIKLSLFRSSIMKKNVLIKLNDIIIDISINLPTAYEEVCIKSGDNTDCFPAVE